MSRKLNYKHKFFCLFSEAFDRVLWYCDPQRVSQTKIAEKDISSLILKLCFAFNRMIGYDLWKYQMIGFTLGTHLAVKSLP